VVNKNIWPSSENLAIFVGNDEEGTPQEEKEDEVINVLEVKE
jgi:hypothetical protein